MELMPIFVNGVTGEGLYAVVYDKQTINEFERLFDLWDDTEYITHYLTENENYLKSTYFKGADIDDLVTQILKEAEELEYLIQGYVSEGFEEGSKKLQMLFKPLHNKEFKLPLFQKTKAKIDNRRYFPKPILRLYGLRISENTFVVTGGVIKLTKNMEDHPDTEHELQKMIQVKEFLRQNDFNSEEDLKILL